MHFHKTICSSHQSEEIKKIIDRTAVRAIILKDNKILMVRSNHGFFKLPGGGVEEGESQVEALLREVAEETGFLNLKVIEKLGIVSEKRQDQSLMDSYFHMDSHHFLCELNDKEKTAQSLIGYELEEGYSPVWVTIQEAIDSNNSAFEKEESHLFIIRENYVLKWLKQNFSI